jgi:hypothetical protein
MDAVLWNLLHDGRIVSAEATAPGVLRLLVDIGYLCELLPTGGEQLVVELHGCDRFEYCPFEGTAVTVPRDVAAIGLEILRAAVESDAMVIECADGSYGGQLRAKYVAAQVLSLEGAPVSLTDLDAASVEYWEAWSRRHTHS